MRTEHKTLSRIESLNNSKNGNPRYRLEFADATSAITSSDISDAYAIGNPGLRERCYVRVKFTRAGRIAQIEPVVKNPAPTWVVASPGDPTDRQRATIHRLARGAPYQIDRYEPDSGVIEVSIDGLGVFRVAPYGSCHVRLLAQGSTPTTRERPA
jgi:hypothetical protein